MPYDARVFHVLIASPGDVQAERNVIADVIYEWNYVNSRDRRIVLLPMRWETHSYPEMGERPQGVINKQVVDNSDMAIGVFWTRMGTPTSEAESGTAEEVERVGASGKPVMIYFSRAKVDIDSIDLEEYARLKAFKQKTYPNGLVETYSSLIEFRDKIIRQLAMKVSELVAQDSAEQSEKTPERVERLSLGFAQGEPPEILPESHEVEVEEIVCVDEDDIPDFGDHPSPEPFDDGEGYYVGSRKNSEYYRELIQYYKYEKLHAPLVLAFSSIGSHGLRDIYIEMSVTPKVGTARISDEGSAVLRPNEDFPSLRFPGMFDVEGSQTLRIEEERDGNWKLEIELPIIHTGRTIFSRNRLRVTASDRSTLEFRCTVYSSELLPFSLRRELNVRHVRREMSFREVLTDLGVEPPKQS